MDGLDGKLAGTATLQSLDESGFVERLWRHDPTVWSDNGLVGEGIRNSLGWLDVAAEMQNRLDEIDGFAAEVREAGFEHVVHLGMGGSSLAPLVFERTFSPDGGLPLTVVDTTDPSTVIGVASMVPVAHTLFIVASKSGTTAEPLAFGEYFFKGVETLKSGNPGDNFVVITDPGTPLEQQALDRGYRRTFLNFPDIGGRYSALSYFGLVPLSLLGIDVGDLLARAVAMDGECRKPAAENPGVMLGAALGEMALAGRDKVTFLMPDSIKTLGAWLEQLLAESTGKEGTGLIPVAGEPPGESASYGDDRIFVYFHLVGGTDARLEQAAASLEEAGQPVLRIDLKDRMDIGREFMRWEIATATAGAVLGINPFDQPNVQESKDNTNRYLGMVREQGELPETEASLTAGGLSVYTSGSPGSLNEALSEFFSDAAPGDYLALLAYLTEDEATTAAIDSIRQLVRDSLKIAATSGYGPRYLHSTGQLHKGGPGSGLYILLSMNEKRDALIPGEPYTFGVFKQAQALGDLEALEKHGRRVMRINLRNPDSGLARLRQSLEEVLQEH